VGSISGLVGEIFLQFYEHLIVKYIVESNNILLYNRYGGDILIIFDDHEIAAEEILDYMSNIHKHPEFKLTCK
jgi:glycosylphosphatidylinositol transamidase (GPIT) subunit GPI8